MLLLGVSFLLLLAPMDELVLPVVAIFNLVVIALAVFESFVLVKPGMLEVRRLTASRLSQGTENEFIYEIRNRTRKGFRVVLRDELPDSFSYEPETLAFDLEPYGTMRITRKALPRIRGRFTLGNIYIRISLFLGTRRLMIPAEAEISVYPNLLEMARYEKLASARRLSDYGIHVARQVSVGREFDQLRYYMPGDDYRDINWKATARMSHPITQTYQIERNQNVLICLDAGRHMTGATGKTGTKFDAAVNAALMLAYIANRYGDRPGLLLFSNEVHTYLEPRRGKIQLNRIIDILYRTHPALVTASYSEMYRCVLTRNRRRSLVVLITDVGEGDEIEDMLRYLPRLAPKHVPVCISVAETALMKKAFGRPADAGDILVKAAALELQNRRKEIMKELVAGGVYVLDLEPAQLTPAAINKYVELKSLQLV
jgi:uncharacterized protein (DUF58 family)